MKIKMNNVRIAIYKAKSEERPECAVTIPLKYLHIGLTLLPKRIKGLLEKEGIDINQCKDLGKEKDLLGNLIEVETANEKLVVSLE